MEAETIRKLVVSVVGVVAAVVIGVTLYTRYLKPHVKQWREARGEITKREKKLEKLRVAFANQRNPKDELKVLEQEIKSLSEANEALKKLKTAGVETSDLPQELQDPDPEIRRELYRDYMKQVMEVAEDGIKERLRNAQISPPEIGLYKELDDADEAAYYMNRAAGLQGIVGAMANARSPDSVFIFDKLTLENYGAGKNRREGAVNVMRYSLKMTMDTQSLLSFLYHLQEEDSYYFIEDMDIRPRTTTRRVGGDQDSASQQLNVEARINTTMIFESQVKAQVVAAAKSVGQVSVGGGQKNWMFMLANAMKKEGDEFGAPPEKKWYQFWKWFSD